MSRTILFQFLIFTFTVLIGSLCVAENSLEIKCKSGDAKACFFKGDETFKSGDEKGSVTWFKKSAKLGASSAYNQLGIMYLQGKGVKKDSIEGHRYMVMAARSGQWMAYFNLCQMWWHGVEMPKNVKIAYMFYLLVKDEPEAKSYLNKISDIENVASTADKEDAKREADLFKSGIQILDKSFAKYFEKPNL